MSGTDVGPRPAVRALGGRRVSIMRACRLQFRDAAPDDSRTIWPIVREVVAAADTVTCDPQMTEDEARGLWMVDSPGRTTGAADGAARRAARCLQMSNPMMMTIPIQITIPTIALSLAGSKVERLFAALLRTRNTTTKSKRTPTCQAAWVSVVPSDNRRHSPRQTYESNKGDQRVQKPLVRCRAKGGSYICDCG